MQSKQTNLHKHIALQLLSNNQAYACSCSRKDLIGNSKQHSGDYVIYRANQLPGYILAASVDDLFEQYTEVVRGADLLAIKCSSSDLIVPLPVIDRSLSV